MRLRGKTWSFFIGHDREQNALACRLKWGGKATERSINGLYRFKNEMSAALYWPLRYLRMGIWKRPQLSFRRRFGLSN